jgi:hypothetical protein
MSLLFMLGVLLPEAAISEGLDFTTLSTILIFLSLLSVITISPSLSDSSSLNYLIII